jgi:hypothetical protein
VSAGVISGNRLTDSEAMAMRSEAVVKPSFPVERPQS